MSEPVETVANEPEVAPILTMRQHQEQYGQEAVAEANAAPPEPPTETAAIPETPAALEQPIQPVTRHRAQSQKPGVLIPELKGKLKAAEERAAAMEAELATLRQAPPKSTSTAAVAPTETQPARSASSADDPEPKDDDPKFAGDWLAYMDERTAWRARQEYRTLRQREQTEATTREREVALGQRFAAAKERHPDFEAVAFGPSPIPQGSIPDQWILGHAAGPEILYYLKSNPPEMDALVRMEPFQQAEWLTLLTQRLVPTSSASAGTTGAATTPKFTPPPKPPTPVRTEAQRVSGTPPPTDGSLSIAEHRKAFGRKTG